VSGEYGEVGKSVCGEAARYNLSHNADGGLRPTKRREFFDTAARLCQHNVVDKRVKTALAVLGLTVKRKKGSPIGLTPFPRNSSRSLPEWKIGSRWSQRFMT
jgi:hypothetical protein